MSEKEDKIATFRFGVIFPLVSTPLKRGEMERIIGEICSREYDIPYSSRTTLSRGTVINWMYRYKNTRELSSLYPKVRNDKGKSKALNDDKALEIVARHNKDKEVPITTILKMMEEEGLCDSPLSRSAAYRLIKESDKRTINTGEKDRRRFQMDNANDMWHLDAMVLSSPLVINDDDKKKYKAKIFALLDDKTRYVVQIRAYLGERAEDLMDLLWRAFNKMGLPKKIFTDNGSAMRDTRIATGLAELEVQYSFARPYQPQGKAKLERFWRTLRMQFVPTLPSLLSLSELNERLNQYVMDYNTRYHTGLEGIPSELYFNEVKSVRPAPLNMPLHFRICVTRRVSQARTISLNNKLYEVPLGYGGKKIELRYSTLDDVEAFFCGESIGKIKEVDLSHNAEARRYGSKEKDE